MKEDSSWMVYRIRVTGHLDESWSDWFDGLQITHEQDGRSLLAIPLPDQAALMALLQRLHHLGVTITKVTVGGDRRNR